MRRKSRFRHMTMQSGIPEDAWGTGARVTMMGKRCILVEGHRGVIELSAERIRLRAGSDIITIQGSLLEVKELSVDAALIDGESVCAVAYGRSGKG